MDFLEELIKSIPEQEKKLSADAQPFIPISVHSENTGLSERAIRMLIEMNRLRAESKK